MTETEFDNGYWYVTELKEFGKTIGIPSAMQLRKDELERAIKKFLVTQQIDTPPIKHVSTTFKKAPRAQSQGSNASSLFSGE